MGFKRIETKRKSTYAAEQIVEAIRRGRYRVGDKLPPEREIAEQMGVSRPSVREAISALQIEANQRFHRAIAEATHNSLLLRALEPLLEVMRQRLPRELRGKYYREDARKFERTYEIHRRIFEALAVRDAARAARAVRRHFDVLGGGVPGAARKL